MLEAFVTQEKPINPKSITGDFYFKGEPTWEPKKYSDLMLFISKLKKFNSKIENSILETHTPIHTANFARSLKKQLEVTKIDDSVAKMFKYKCPFNGYKHYAIAPVMLFRVKENIDELFKFEAGKEPLLPSHAKDIFKDHEYMVNQHKLQNEDDGYGMERDYLSGLQSIAMGMGYTEGCYPSDGCPSNEYFLMEYTNSDYLLVKVLLWCNN